MSDPEDKPTVDGPEVNEPDGPALAVFAHPDDAEIAAGGSLIRWADQGRAVHLLVLTNGDRGSEDPEQDRAELAATRRKETEAAAGLMGLAGFEVLATHDGELQNTLEARARIARTVRRIRPAILLTCDPTAWFFGNRYFNHSDHRTAGAVTLDAIFPGAGNPLFFTEQLADGLQPWKVPVAWLGWTNEPNHFQDISGLMERKLGALAAHASQVQGDMMRLFEEWLPLEAQEHGRKIGAQHAEAFRVLSFD